MTFNRGKLLRLAQQGKLEMVASYNFDDMHGASRSNHSMPVAIMPDKRSDCKEGICYVFPSDFRSLCGRAWQNQNGTVTLKIHSNADLTFRIKEGAL